MKVELYPVHANGNCALTDSAVALLFSSVVCCALSLRCTELLLPLLLSGARARARQSWIHGLWSFVAICCCILQMATCKVRFSTHSKCCLGVTQHNPCNGKSFLPSFSISTPKHIVCFSLTVIGVLLLLRSFHFKHLATIRNRIWNMNKRYKTELNNCLLHFISLFIFFASHLVTNITKCFVLYTWVWTKTVRKWKYSSREYSKFIKLSSIFFGEHFEMCVGLAIQNSISGESLCVFARMLTVTIKWNAARFRDLHRTECHITNRIMWCEAGGKFPCTWFAECVHTKNAISLNRMFRAGRYVSFFGRISLHRTSNTQKIGSAFSYHRGQCIGGIVCHFSSGTVLCLQINFSRCIGDYGPAPSGMLVIRMSFAPCTASTQKKHQPKTNAMTLSALIPVSLHIYLLWNKNMQIKYRKKVRLLRSHALAVFSSFLQISQRLFSTLQMNNYSRQQQTKVSSARIK